MSKIIFVMLMACIFVGCGSLVRAGEVKAAKPSSGEAPINRDLLSIDGELFPLSTFYGVCANYRGIWGATLHSGPIGPHYPTGGEVSVEGGIKLKISVGKFDMLPGATLKDIPAVTPSRRLQIGRDRFGSSFVLVSDFTGAGNNRVSIEYEENDAEAKSAAIRLANAVVACHVSVVSKP